MTTTYTDLMPANTTAPTTVPNRGTDHAEATTGEEVNSMSLFDIAVRRPDSADLDRLVVLERIKQRRKAEAHMRAVHAQLWGLRATR